MARRIAHFSILSHTIPAWCMRKKCEDALSHSVVPERGAALCTPISRAEQTNNSEAERKRYGSTDCGPWCKNSPTGL